MNNYSKQPNVIVLGGGTAGFLTALTLRKCLPLASIRVVQSSKLGVIGVGEGSLRQLPGFLHDYLSIDPARFFAEVRPTPKLGIRFMWGERDDFNYTFAPQLDTVYPHPDLPRPTGYYCYDEMENHCVASVLMRNDLAFLVDDNGEPVIGDDFGYHLDNRRLAAFLEACARERGISIVDDLVTGVDSDGDHMNSLHFESGSDLQADIFVDCSGFGSLLLGKHLAEPYVSYRDTLYCDRAVIGGWERRDEPLHPYTTSETMAAGWCWQIEHEARINRGYVYASEFISDADAEAEFRQQNPEVTESSVVRFRSGRFERAWVGNVIAIGNSAGFVEPLEATAIAVICSSARALAESLAAAGGEVNAAIRDEFNHYNARSWDTIADFLAVHYRFNSRLDTPFWRECRAHVELRGAERIVDFYRANGPSQLWRLTLEDPVCRFRLDGYYTLLVGQKVPHAQMNIATERERRTWEQLRAATAHYGARGISVVDTLKRLRAGNWRWKPEHFAA